MNKMKCICSFVAAALLTGNAFAAEGKDVNVIRLQKTPQSVMSLDIGYLEDYEGRSTVYIVPAEKLSEAKSGDMSSDVFMGEADLNSFKASFDFLMPTGAANGVYAAVSGEGSNGESIEERTRYFRYNSDAAAVAQELSSLNTAEDFKAALLNGAANSWFLNTEASAWKTNEAAVVSLVKSMKNGGFGSAYAVEEAFSAACDIVNIKNLSNDRIIADVIYYNDILGCDISNSDFNKYREQTAEKFKTIMAGSAVKDVDSVKSNFTAACALACMSNSNRTTAIEDLQRYNDVFNLDFNGNFTKIDKYELAKVFENADYTTVEQVRERFSSEINRLLNADGGAGGSTGGTGGGSGGASGTSGGVGVSNIYTGPGAGLVEKINSVSNIFSDVQGNHWAADQIRFVYENGIMTGDADGTFRPEDKITREEWAKVVLSAFSISLEDAECEFDDVDKSQWYYPFVAKAYMLGIVNGLDEKNFGIGKLLTRQDAVVMMHRTTEMARDIRATLPAELSFSDTDEISEYALNPIKIFVAMKVINGYENGKFVPSGSITRAEAAKIICSLLDEVD